MILTIAIQELYHLLIRLLVGWHYSPELMIHLNIVELTCGCMLYHGKIRIGTILQLDCYPL